MNYGGDGGGHEHMSHGSSSRPMFATVTVAVCHSGAGCVLGDVVGEWLVYGTNATIAGRLLYSEVLVGMLCSYSPCHTITDICFHHRLWLRDCFWRVFPILEHCPDGGRVRAQNPLPSPQGGRLVLDIFRDWFVWMDGYLSDRHLQLEAGNESCYVLVDDADWYVPGSLDLGADQLVVDQERSEETLRIDILFVKRLSNGQAHN